MTCPQCGSVFNPIVKSERFRFRSDKRDYRRRMVQVAALAVAAIETVDRADAS